MSNTYLDVLENGDRDEPHFPTGLNSRSDADDIWFDINKHVRNQRWDIVTRAFDILQEMGEIDFSDYHKAFEIIKSKVRPETYDGLFGMLDRYKERKSENVTVILNGAEAISELKESLEEEVVNKISERLNPTYKLVEKALELFPQQVSFNHNGIIVTLPDSRVEFSNIENETLSEIYNNIGSLVSRSLETHDKAVEELYPNKKEDFSVFLEIFLHLLFQSGIEYRIPHQYYEAIYQAGHCLVSAAKDNGDLNECKERAAQILKESHEAKCEQAWFLTFDEYAREAHKTAIYPTDDNKGLYYTAMLIAGEAGEIAGKISKIMRDDNCNIHSDPDKRQAILDEIGDVTWGLAALCYELQASFGDVAQRNLDKLADRQRRNKIGGSGDRR